MSRRLLVLSTGSSHYHPTVEYSLLNEDPLFFSPNSYWRVQAARSIVLSHPHPKLPLGDFYVTTAVFQASEYMHCALRSIGSLNSHLGIQVISVCSCFSKRQVKIVPYCSHNYACHLLSLIYSAFSFCNYVYYTLLFFSPSAFSFLNLGSSG